MSDYGTIFIAVLILSFFVSATICHILSQSFENDIETIKTNERALWQANAGMIDELDILRARVTTIETKLREREDDGK